MHFSWYLFIYLSPNLITKAFVCSTKADMETFNREIYDNQRLQVQSVCVTETRDYRHPIPVEQVTIENGGKI